jgi:hypothetical protein
MKSFRQIKEAATEGPYPEMSGVRFNMHGMRTIIFPSLSITVFKDTIGHEYSPMSWTGDNGDSLPCLVRRHDSDNLVK